MKKILILIIFSTILSGCFSEEWSGYVYPDRSNLSNHKYIGTFESLELCRAEAIASLEQYGGTRNGDYECGLNCKDSVCEKTEQ